VYDLLKSEAFLLRLCLICSVAVVLIGCTSETSSNALGDAYVAPGSLNLRSGLAQKSAAVAVLAHGDHLTVLDVKRRYVKVRTDKGATGWLDSRQLLSKDQMQKLQADTQHALRLPSQGHATVFDTLNIHIDPSRTSPAFAQIPQGGSVEVIAHSAVQKALGPQPVSSPSFLKPPPPPPRRSHRTKQQKGNALLPPLPGPPKPPDNWLDLSSERVSGQNEPDEPTKEKEAPKKEESKSLMLDDWSLVRTNDKKIGWVLSRNLYMSIPDEVAQYAEGQRISSYFDFGDVTDSEKGLKHNWLWTTSSKAQDFDFDRFRVFYWNRRRHRYETSYRQKDLVGYFPVVVEPAEAGTTSRYFSLILQDDSGKYQRKRFVFDGTLVHLVSTEAYQPASGHGPTKAAPIPIEQMEQQHAQPGWIRRQFQKLLQLFHRT
jgi:hypothetical protein